MNSSTQLKALGSYASTGVNQGANSPKAFRQSSAPKLDQAPQTSELRAWLEEAYAYYNWVLGVKSGQIQLRPGEEQDLPQDDYYLQELYQQILWAQQQLGSSGAWDPLSENGSGGSPNLDSEGEDPFGGIPGTHGNWVHNQEEAHIGFIGDDVRDIWSNRVVIDVAPMSATVRAVLTQDESLQPPEDVVKIIVEDKATGTQAVYVIHNPDAEININTVKGTVDEDSTGGRIQVGRFHPRNSNPGAASGGELQEDGSLLYDVPAGEVIHLQSEGSGDRGDQQVHDIYGDADITVRNSDQVEVARYEVRYDPETGTEKAEEYDGFYKIVVTHRDGSQDTYLIHEGFQTNLNAPESAVTFRADYQADGWQVHDLSSENPLGSFSGLSLNGDTGENNGDSQEFNPDQPLNSEDAGLVDSVPSRVEDQVAYYDTPGEAGVTLHTYFDDDVSEHHIVTSGPVNLSVASNTDKVYVEKVGDAYRVVVYRRGITDPQDPNFKKETYLIEGNPSEINIQAIENNVRVSASQVGQWAKPADPDTEDYDRGVPYVAGTLAGVSVSGESPTWPGTQIYDNIPEGGRGSRQAAELVERLNQAIRTGNWRPVTEFLNGIGADQGDDILRKVLTALFNVAGDEAGFMDLLQRLPDGIRGQMAQILSRDPAGVDRENGDEFSNGEAAQWIRNSLDAE